jgi:hypothetical protein
MVPKPLASDTSAEVERMQIERWRAMTAAEKAAIVTSLTQTVVDLARAGIRHRYPNATAREQFLRLAVVTLGSELARKAYPEIASLDLS